VTPADLPILYRHQRDPDANAIAAVPSRERTAFLAHWSRILGDTSTDKQAILVDRRVVGYIMCFDHLGQREVGYWLGREHRGKGIATRALAAFLDRVATRPLYARVTRQNRASLRVLEKCGFSIVAEEHEVAGSEAIDLVILRLGAGDTDHTDHTDDTGAPTSP
jgi:RimJ/RimL family protein N-acetyltransferase